MANRVSATAMEGIHTLFHLGAMGTWTDSQLIDHFLSDQEASEAAFRVLIHRHGPMVLGICRRVLGDEHAAEDAFQSTFMVLVKKGGRLRDGNLLNNWLYGVALRVAKKERDKEARRQYIERRAAQRTPDADADSGQAELRSVIDEEIRRLPERYRVPLILCHMEGLRHDEVASRLGCPVGTVESRLSRARDQLRTRLARRGLAPSASVMGAILRPPGTSVVTVPLVEATLQAAIALSTRLVLVETGVLTCSSSFKRTLASFRMLHLGKVASALILAAGATVMTLAAYRVEGEPTGLASAHKPPQSISLAHGQTSSDRSLKTRIPSKQGTTSTPQPIAEKAPKPVDPIRATRFPSAIAEPLEGITIDGRLDDWPKNLTEYTIGNQLRDHPSYNSKKVDVSSDPDPHFMVGYDADEEQIYLAVVVPDHDVVVHPSATLKTDAVEIYIDGTFSDKTSAKLPSGDWRDTFDAATMPVLQYVGVPGPMSAYGDKWNANPSLVYARARQTATKMKYRNENNITTYEWSVKPFDRFPDRPTRFHPGKRLGLELAVVDKDAASARGSLPPTFRTWGAPPEIFKGADASTLGELILAGQSAPGFGQ